MNSLKFLCVALCLIIAAAGCNSIPAGKAPQGHIVQPAAGSPDTMNCQDAVNYMITSISMRCQPLSGTKAVKPVVSRRFLCAETSNPDHMAEKVYACLIRESLIAARVNSQPEYYLESTVSNAKPVNGKEVFCWQMRFVSADLKKVFWEETIFVNKDSLK